VVHCVCVCCVCFVCVCVCVCVCALTALAAAVSFDDAEFSALVASHGTVVRSFIMRDKVTGRSKGYG
jgi:hypothetical protein